MEYNFDVVINSVDDADCWIEVIEQIREKIKRDNSKKEYIEKIRSALREAQKAGYDITIDNISAPAEDYITILPSDEFTINLD